MKVRFKKLHPAAVTPQYAHTGEDAAMDLTATTAEFSDDGMFVTYGTGIAIELPKGYVGLVFPRSSVYKTTMQLSNCVGVIDSGYRGEITAKFYSCINEKHYRVGDRVAQLMILPYPEIEMEEVQELANSKRGMGGYGSTGISTTVDTDKEHCAQIVFNAVCKVFGVTQKQFVGKDRKALYVDARSVASKLLRECGFSLHEIGYYTHRSHSTVLYALKHYSDIYSTDSAFAFNCDRVFSMLSKKYS